MKSGLSFLHQLHSRDFDSNLQSSIFSSYWKMVNIKCFFFSSGPECLLYLVHSSLLFTQKTHPGTISRACQNKVQCLVQNSLTRGRLDQAFVLIEQFIQQTDDPSQVIEEAKALAAQSLASVTYQINSLACTLLKLLDSQAMQMKDMESSVNLISLVSGTFPTLSPEVQP